MARRTNQSYVVTIGANGYPLAYLLHKSLRRVNEYRNIAVRKLTQRTRMAGTLVDITHGPTIVMTYTDLRRQIPGFNDIVTCLDAGGLLMAVRPETTGTDQWMFDCEMAPTQPYPGRLPHPREVLMDAPRHLEWTTIAKRSGGRLHVAQPVPRVAYIIGQDDCGHWRLVFKDKHTEHTISSYETLAEAKSVANTHWQTYVPSTTN